jgi:hypothetical protein
LTREVLQDWGITSALRYSLSQEFILMTGHVIFQRRNSTLGLNASNKSLYKPMKPVASPFQKRLLLQVNEGGNHVEHGAITPFAGMSGHAYNVAH